MKILYYTWSEYTYTDAAEVLRRMGHELTVVSFSHASYDEDESFISSVTASAKENQCDLVFSFNYYPDLSRAAMRLGIPYVSWCFDSPLLTLESVTLGNDCNRVYLFDRAWALRLQSEGFSTVHYMPLACNIERLEKQMPTMPTGYLHDVTFLGTLYDNEYDFYSQISSMPESLRGYLDGVMEAQMQIFGADMISTLITHEFCDEFAKCADIKMGPLYRECRDDIIRFMIQKQTTVRERRRLLTVISEVYSTDHYCEKAPHGINVNYKGYAEYLKQMPEIFHTSRINLNITLRSIITGIPLRIIDILGAGGFCLTNYQEELTDYFTDDIDISWYTSSEELFEKLQYYMSHDTEREAVAKRGHEIAARQFSYENMFAKILSL